MMRLLWSACHIMAFADHLLAVGTGPVDYVWKIAGLVVF
jgi:hypothetical protein